MGGSRLEGDAVTGATSQDLLGTAGVGWERWLPLDGVRFADPHRLEWLWGVVFLAVLAAFCKVLRSRRLRAISVSPRIRAHLILRGRPLGGLVRAALPLLALALAVAAWAGPQWGGAPSSESATVGVDVVFAVDVSLSMGASDTAPQRLVSVRRAAADVLGGLRNARVAVLIGARDALVLCPFTADRPATALFLDSIELGMMPEGGTRIGRLLDHARQTLRKSPQTQKRVVLFSDGEDWSGGAEEAARALRDEGAVLHCVGAGTAAGAEIPVGGQPVTADVKRDGAGRPVVTRLDEAHLKRLAEVAGGVYRHVTDPDSTAAVVSACGGGTGATAEASGPARREDRYQAPLALSVAALLLSFSLAGRPSEKRGISR